MASIKNYRTTRSTGYDRNLTPRKTYLERILQYANSLSFETVCKNLGIKTQEQETVDTIESALATNYEVLSQNLVLVNAVAQAPLAS